MLYSFVSCNTAKSDYTSCYDHAAPPVWNKLSKTVTSDITVSIATFKSRLKTALYNRAFLR